MALVGMYHYRKDPRKVSRAYQYAAIASIEGFDFFYFTAKRVNFEKKTILGLYYEDGMWQEKQYPFPDIFINHVGPITSFQKDVYNKLKKEISYTSNPVGTKLSVYNYIKKGNEFTDYLIEYQFIKKPINVLEFLQRHPQIIMKPISGHHGNKIIYIEKTEEDFLVKEESQTKHLSRIEFYNFIIDILKSNKMLMQRYIPSKTTSKEPFDIRLHVQKDENGNWQNTLIYPKIGFSHKIATNLRLGGKITILKNFLLDTYGDEYFDIMKYLEVFAIQFAKHFDTLYNHKFDELGIDIGLDENKKIWIYEVNWRPGHIFLESKASIYAVKYANYLGEKKRRKKNENHKLAGNL